jgi:hypothetical protein
MLLKKSKDPTTILNTRHAKKQENVTLAMVSLTKLLREFNPQSQMLMVSRE